jgi:hypothetical protein
MSQIDVKDCNILMRPVYVLSIVMLDTGMWCYRCALLGLCGLACDFKADEYGHETRV